MSVRIPENVSTWLSMSVARSVIRYERLSPHRAVANGPLGAMETGKEDARGVTETVRDHRTVGQFEIERCADQVLRHV
jgi:hypothetical protein